MTAGDVPTPGPWLVRGEAHEGSSPEIVMLGVEPATEDGRGGWPYLIRQDRTVEVGGSLLHLATGIQRLADAIVMAAAPELAGALFRLLTSPVILAGDLDPGTRDAVARGWALLVRAAPHLEIGADHLRQTGRECFSRNTNISANNGSIQ